MFENFRHEGISHDRFRRGDGGRILEGLGGGDDVRANLEKMIEADSGQPLQNQVGSAVRLLDAGANQSQTTDPASGATGILHCHGKHPGTLECFL
jgi:hypothetical protein